jgi:hypothetical protein
MPFESAKRLIEPLNLNEYLSRSRLAIHRKRDALRLRSLVVEIRIQLHRAFIGGDRRRHKEAAKSGAGVAGAGAFHALEKEAFPTSPVIRTAPGTAKFILKVKFAGEHNVITIVSMVLVVGVQIEPIIPKSLPFDAHSTDLFAAGAVGFRQDDESAVSPPRTRHKDKATVELQSPYSEGLTHPYWLIAACRLHIQGVISSGTA